MSGLEIAWPDESAERVRADRGRLLVAGEALRRLPSHERLARVAAVLERWTRPDSPWRRELIDALASASGFTQGTVREGLDAALRAWHPEALVDCGRREIAAQCDAGRALAPFEWTLVVAGGSIPMPTLLTALLPLALGSPVMLRESRHDPITPDLLARSLAECDETLARAFAPVRFPVEDAAAYAAALEAPCVVATGSDDTLRAIAARLDGRQRLVGYGHRFSIGVVGAGLAAEPRALGEVAHGFALDVARWDQSGCLSPLVVYLVDVPRTTAERFALSVAERLEELADTMPRGDLDPAAAITFADELASARMRSGPAGARVVAGASWGVVLEADPTPRPTPLGRFLRLHPVDSDTALARALRPFHGHLSNAAVAGFAAEDPEPDADRRASTSISEATIRNRLVDAGLSRITRPGRLQTPPVDWPRDGFPLFTPRARFVRAEGIGA